MHKHTYTQTNNKYSQMQTKLWKQQTIVMELLANKLLQLFFMQAFTILKSENIRPPVMSAPSSTSASASLSKSSSNMELMLLAGALRWSKDNATEYHKLA